MTNRHKLMLENRSKLLITEVSEVYSFDENVVNLQIGEEMDLTVSGEGLTISKLEIKPDAPDGGEVVINGSIEAIMYSEINRKQKKDGSAKSGKLFGLFGQLWQ